jgi:hypothetical protein
MLQTALQGLELVGSRLLGREEAPRKKDHRTIAIALCMMGEPEDLGLHVRKDYRSIIAAIKKEEIDDPGHRIGHPTIHVMAMLETQSLTRV